MPGSVISPEFWSSTGLQHFLASLFPLPPAVLSPLFSHLVKQRLFSDDSDAGI